MTSLPPDKVNVVSQKNIQRIFNKSQYPSMIAAGLLTAQYLRDDHLKEPEKKREPHCTRGQMIRYRASAGQWVVEVFQYLRKDGTIGASGKPDPKRIRIGNEVFIIERTQRT